MAHETLQLSVYARDILLKVVTKATLKADDLQIETHNEPVTVVGL